MGIWKGRFWKGDVSNDQLKKILIPEASIHVIEDQVENPDVSEEDIKEDRADVPEEKRRKGERKGKREG